MGKVHMNISIDHSVVEYHRAKRTNISKTVEDYLKTLMGENYEEGSLEPKITELKASLAKLEMEKAQREQALKVKASESRQEEFKEEIMKLANLNLRKEQSDKWAESRFGIEMQRVKKEYDLNMPDLLLMVRGQKPARLVK